MALSNEQCCVLNQSPGGWAFEPLAIQLSKALGIEISDCPRRLNYLLHVDRPEDFPALESFVPLQGIQWASDKRELARCFATGGVRTPETHLKFDWASVQSHLVSHAGQAWCLKFPVSCGANGHRMVDLNDPEPLNWPKPFVLQEFIRLAQPEVYRTYCAGGTLFGWVARRFPKGTAASPWVAHARGARYEVLGEEAPPEAAEQARRALQTTNLLRSFGCVDLLQRSDGPWLVLEVGSDGLVNHVDREIGDKAFEEDLLHRIAMAFERKKHDLS